MLANCTSRVSVWALILLTATAVATAQQDKWNGGTGKWSVDGSWSLKKKPTKRNDVVIYSGGDDDVTLDINAGINSLMLGGKANTFSSGLSDGGVKQIFSIAKGLTVGAQGVLDFSGNGSSISAGTIANDGSLTIGKGVTLDLTNQPNGVTAVAQGSAWKIGGNFSVGGTANTGFAKLDTVKGALDFANGTTQTISPPKKLLTVTTQGEGGGSLDVSDGTTLTINGDLYSDATITTSGNGKGKNTLTINGKYTSAMGAFQLEGPGDVAIIANMDNTGSVTIDNQSSATVTGTLNNGGSIKIDKTSKFVVGAAKVPPKGLGYIQLANGTLGEMISKDDYGTIQADGPASLNGTLDILLQGGFNPAVGTTYNIILFSPNKLNGTFARIQNDIFNGGTEKWIVNYQNGGGMVQLMAQANKNPSTPEPSTFRLFASGLLAFSYGFRRWQRRR